MGAQGTAAVSPLPFAGLCCMGIAHTPGILQAQLGNAACLLLRFASLKSQKYEKPTRVTGLTALALVPGQGGRAAPKGGQGPR